MPVPGQGDGVTLPMSLADQLALGRVLYRYLTDQTEHAELDDDSGDLPAGLHLSGWVNVTRDDELRAVFNALGIGQEPVQSIGHRDDPL